MYNSMYSMEPPAAAVRPTARMILTKVGFEFSNCYKLGSGRYSKVYKGLYKDASRHFAIKIIDLEKISAEFKQKFLPREMAVWRMLDHAGHVFLYKDFQKYGYHFAIMELGIEDMLTHVQRNGPIEQGQSRGWMLQLIDALKYMHGKGIAHRDLKLENVLLFDGGILKIADYGFCKQSSDLASTFCGSKSYSAPEILRGIRYDTFKADIWSLGVLAFIMVTNTMPFREDVDNVTIIDAQRHRRYHFSNRLGLTTECTATIDRMLTFDPKSRPIISECAHLPWFNSGGSDEDGNNISNFLPIIPPPPMADVTNNIRPQTSKGGAGSGGHHHHHHQRRSNNYYYNNNNGGGHNNGMAHG